MASWGGSGDITSKFTSVPLQETISGENALEKVGWELRNILRSGVAIYPLNVFVLQI